MQTPRREAHTFLTHLFGSGPRRRALRRRAVPLDGRRRHPSPARPGGGRRAGAGRSARPPPGEPCGQMRPARDEIIVLHGPEPHGLGACSIGALRRRVFLANAGSAEVKSPLRGTSRRPRAGRMPSVFQPPEGGEQACPIKDPGKARAYGRERHRKRAAERLTQGLCPKCGKDPARGRPQGV